MPKTLVTLLLLFAPISADAAVHVWTGATSNVFSNAANWTGGSPAGDPAAELIFPPGATRVAITNDLPALNVRTLSITGSGYSIDGLPLTLASDAELVDSSSGPNTLGCDLELAGGVTVRAGSVSYDDGGLIVAGAIHGAGPLVKLGDGRLTFSGPRPNSYSGGTRVHDGELHLAKSDGVDAISGDLLIGSEAMVLSLGNEHIPDSATIQIGGRFGVGGIETVGPLVVERGAQIQHEEPLSGTIPFVGTLILSGDVTILPGDGSNIFFGRHIALAGTRTFTSCESCSTVTLWSVRDRTPGSGLTLRGGRFDIRNGEYHGPTAIEDAHASVFNPNTAVRLRGGSFSGEVASLVVEKGTIDGPTRTSGDMRLNAATIVQVALNEPREPLFSTGALDLGRATLVLTNEPYPRVLGAAYRIAQRLAPGPIAGTFGGLPDGAVIGGRYRISYLGNEVMLTAIGRHATEIHTHAEHPSLAIGGKTLVIAQVGSGVNPVRSGTITFREDDTILATLPVDGNGRASIEVQPSFGMHVYVAKYNGTEIFAPSEEDWDVVHVLAPAPTITSIDPTTVQSDTVVYVTVRGTDFYPGGVIELSGSGVQTSYVSSTEVVFTWQVPRFSIDVMRNVAYRQAAPSSALSNLVPIDVKAASPATSPLAFEQRAIAGPVAAGGGAAWMSVAYRRINFSTTLERRTAITMDTDRDGRARWEQPDDVPSTGIWVMTDLTDGTLIASRPNGEKPERSAFPQAMFLRDEQGRYSYMVLMDCYKCDLLWVRPGAGAWTMTADYGDDSDLEDPLNTLGVYKTSQMRPVGDSPAAPAGFEPGDVLSGIHWSSHQWFGDRVDSHLHESDGPGKLLLRHPHNLNEETDAVPVSVLRLGGTDGTIGVDYTTFDGTAIAGVHYEARAGRLTFGPGEILKTFEIPIIDDETYSGFTHLNIELSAPAGTTIFGSGISSVQLNDDDPRPTLSAENVVVTEGDHGRREVPMTFRLSGSTRVPVRVQWSYSVPESGEAVSGELTFVPGGATSQTITIPYEANEVPQENRIIQVSLLADTADPGYADATVTVVDDDVVGITVLDAAVVESGTAVAVRLATMVPSEREVTVRYRTEDGTATAGRDYTTTTGTVTFSNGDDEETVYIPILRDSNAEGDEWFKLELSDVTNAELHRSSATVIILDDDQLSALPVLTASSPTVGEDNANFAGVELRLSFAVQHDVRFRVATASGSATAGADFTSKNELILIPAGSTEWRIYVPVFNDSVPEGRETFSIVLSEPVGATIATPSVLATILDGDVAPPAYDLSVTGADVIEGGTVRFSVRLSRAATSVLTVPYATTDGTAVAGDYQPVSGVVTFAPGQIATAVDVATVDDAVYEFDETFGLVVGNAMGTARVINNDPVPPPRGRAVRH